MLPVTGIFCYLFVNGVIHLCSCLNCSITQSTNSSSMFACVVDIMPQPLETDVIVGSGYCALNLTFTQAYL